MFSPEPIGHIRSPYQNTQQVPKGLGAQHAAEGILDILPQYEAGLTDIEGFSHLIVLWVFDRAGGFELLGTPPSDNRPHGVFATRSPRRPNPIGLTRCRTNPARGISAACPRSRHARRDSHSRSQALLVEYSRREVAERLAGGSGTASQQVVGMAGRRRLLNPGEYGRTRV